MRVESRDPRNAAHSAGIRAAKSAGRIRKPKLAAARSNSIRPQQKIVPTVAGMQGHLISSVSSGATPPSSRPPVTQPHMTGAYMLEPSTAHRSSCPLFLTRMTIKFPSSSPEDLRIIFLDALYVGRYMLFALPRSNRRGETRMSARAGLETGELRTLQGGGGRRGGDCKAA